MSPFFPNMDFCPTHGHGREGCDGPGFVCWCGGNCGGPGFGCGCCGCGCGCCGRGGGCGGKCGCGWYDECFLMLGKVIDDTNLAPNCSCRCRCCICGGWCGSNCRCVRCGNVCIDNCRWGDCCCRAPGGRICIHKVDANDRTMPLACAEFELQDSNCMPCAIGCTDANGNVCFSGLRNGTYFLREVTPPAGYQLNQDVTSVTLTPFENQIFLEIADTPIVPATGSITVMARAVNNGGAPLSGLRIGLMNASAGTVATATTDATGTARFAGIPFGTYTVNALDTPAGSTTPGPIQVTVSADSPHPVIAIDFAPLLPPNMAPNMAPLMPPNMSPLMPPRMSPSIRMP